MTWHRADFCKALYDLLSTAPWPPGTPVDPDDYVAGPPTIFERPPSTVNPPAVVIGRPTEVRYSEAAFGVDMADFGVLCVGPIDGDDIVDGLIGFVRSAIGPDPTLGGTCKSLVAGAERNWRALRVAGVDVLVAEVALEVMM
jgi:hypothetical protein